MSEGQLKAMKESIISSLLVYANATRGTELRKSDQDVRDQISEAVDDLVGGISVDESSWPYVRNQMLYDVYLAMREEEGTITSMDRHRSGLNVAMFSNRAEFNTHLARISEARVAGVAEEYKVCSSCEMEKPMSKFKKKGGAVCNACRCRAYRERKQAGVKHEN